MATRRERELLRELDQAYSRIDELESYIVSGQELIEDDERQDARDENENNANERTR